MLRESAARAPMELVVSAVHARVAELKARTSPPTNAVGGYRCGITALARDVDTSECSTPAWPVRYGNAIGAYFAQRRSSYIVGDFPGGGEHPAPLETDEQRVQRGASSGRAYIVARLLLDGCRDARWRCAMRGDERSALRALPAMPLHPRQQRLRTVWLTTLP